MASDRAVIFIQGAFGGGLPRVSLEEPATHPDATKGLDLNYLPLAGLFNLMKTGPCLPDVVEQVGKTLYNLIGRHPAIAADFVTRFDPGNQNEGPIYLRLESEDVENLPWEALNEVRNGFIAMDRRWPIARLKRVAQSKAKAEYLFLPPLKIMAVMGASGQDAFTQISALAELIKLKDAVEQSGLNVVLRVLVCEDQLKSTIENWNHDWMQVAFIVDDDKLFQEIASFEPQLLHFFCQDRKSVV